MPDSTFFDWEKIGTFVQVVGVPFAILLLFVGPFVYLCFNLVQKYGAQIAESHLSFMTSASETQEKNAETLSRLEDVIAKKHLDHSRTHKAIYLIASAGISMLDADNANARLKLNQAGDTIADRDEMR
jgi:hypothetical protein